MLSLLFPESFRHVCFSQNTSDICQGQYIKFFTTPQLPLQNTKWPMVLRNHGRRQNAHHPYLLARWSVMQSDDYEVFFRGCMKNVVSISKANDVDSYVNILYMTFYETCSKGVSHCFLLYYIVAYRDTLYYIAVYWIILRHIPWYYSISTLPETNIAPQKMASQKEMSIPNINFQRLWLLVSGKVYSWYWIIYLTR